MPAKIKRNRINKPKLKRSASKPKSQCDLCGNTKKLTKTECCDEWICDDEDKYVLFTYATNSCHRNHRRYTLCGYHHTEEHSGHWKDCQQCKETIETEMYAYYGTNEYNFEKLKNPPDYKPTECAKCNTVIVLSEGGYSVKSGEYFCAECSNIEFPRF